MLPPDVAAAADRLTSSGLCCAPSQDRDTVIRHLVANPGAPVPFRLIIEGRFYRLERSAIPEPPAPCCGAR